MYGIKPDLSTFGKIIGGGAPVGAFGGREEIMALYDPRSKQMTHSGTFNGNALAMTGGIITLKNYRRDYNHMEGRPQSGTQGDRYVFIRHRAPYSGMKTIQACRYALKKVLSAYGLELPPGEEFHITRKTFATQLLTSKNSFDDISNALATRSRNLRKHIWRVMRKVCVFAPCLLKV